MVPLLLLVLRSGLNTVGSTRDNARHEGMLPRKIGHRGGSSPSRKGPIGSKGSRLSEA